MRPVLRPALRPVLQPVLRPALRPAAARKLQRAAGRIVFHVCVRAIAGRRPAAKYEPAFSFN